jgi:hypothetical protein
VSRLDLSTTDLSLEEQAHVRNALTFLHAKLETWKSVARLLRFEKTTVLNVGNGVRTATASMAFRIARVVGVSVDDLLAGKFPEPGTCPRCGYKAARAKAAR